MIHSCGDVTPLCALGMFTQCSRVYNVRSTRLQWVKSLGKNREQKLGARLLDSGASIGPRFALGTEGHASLTSKWRNAPLTFLRPLNEN